jgi:hypothetical protein
MLAIFGSLARGSATVYTNGPYLEIDFTTIAYNGTIAEPQHQLLLYFANGVATIASTTLSAGPSAGATTISLTATTNMQASEKISLYDSTVGNTEIVEIQTLSGTTIKNGLQFSHANGTSVYGQAEQWIRLVDCSAFNAFRLNLNNTRASNVCRMRAGFGVIR